MSRTGSCLAWFRAADSRGRVRSGRRLLLWILPATGLVLGGMGRGAGGTSRPGSPGRSGTSRSSSLQVTVTGSQVEADLIKELLLAFLSLASSDIPSR